MTASSGRLTSRVRWSTPWAAALGLLAATGANSASGQTAATLAGRITDAESGAPVATASVSVEGFNILAVSDSTGRYALRAPPGPQFLVVERIGYARTRIQVTIPASGVVIRNVELASSALRIPGLTVTADPLGRARGELGTASVVDRDAIDVQTATSLAGILELTPGVELRPPGLDLVEQIALRAAPTSTVASILAGGPSAADIAAFGTAVVLDGVPLSNNANLQTTGPRGELRIAGSSGGGVDLRRIPAATLERVEVIRGVPSARYGDLTQGVIVVDTRAGVFDPALRVLFDPHTGSGGFAGGWRVADRQSLSSTFDVTRTVLNPGLRSDQVTRVAGQLSYRSEMGLAPEGGPGGGASNGGPRFVVDGRVDAYQLYAEVPEDTTLSPGSESSNRDAGIRLLGRGTYRTAVGPSLHLTASADYQRQRSFLRARRSRPGLPFTDRLEEGRAVGRFIGGEYLTELDIAGDVWHVFSRLEAGHQADWWGADHALRAGLELRREWNAGAGYQFEIERPPQSGFNGVQGFDRPRPYDELDPLLSSALYVDDRLLMPVGSAGVLEVQAGVRLDVLHGGGRLTDVRDALLEPRFNLQYSPRRWLRLRGAAGTTSKLPALGQLSPAPQYFDVVNVNWFANDPAERLAVLTTFIRDTENPGLGLSRGRKAEVGFELSTSAGDASLGFTAFDDRTDGAIGFRETPGFVLRDRFQLSDSTFGTGRPPEILEPPFATDSIPIALDVPANNLTLESRGLEATLRLPVIRPLSTRLEVQGAYIETKLFKEGLDLGFRFTDFQLDERLPRAPFWESVTKTGKRGLAVYRIVHHQPALGLVITGTVQHVFFEQRQNAAGTDTLAFAGYMTRGGNLVHVAPEDRVLPEYEDLRRPRLNTFTDPSEVQPDWLFSVEVALSLPLDGRLSFYAFNALDRPGRRGDQVRQPRFHPSMRFGLEGGIPLIPVTRTMARAVSGGP